MNFRCWETDGNVIHPHERECSIQLAPEVVKERRAVSYAKTRAVAGLASCRAAKSVGYYSAGTVEFIVDKDRKFISSR